MSRAVMVLAVLTVSVACGSVPADPQAGAAQPAVSVATAVAARAARAELLPAGGTLHGRRAVTLSARVMAPVVDVAVRAGDRVTRGQLLVQLDAAASRADTRAAAAAREAADRGLDRRRAEAAAADAAVALARSTHARIAALHARRSATDQERDAAASALASAEAFATAAVAAVAEAEATVARATAAGDGAAAVAEWARVTAPFDAVVTERFVDPGTLATPGLSLVSIEDVTALELDVRIDDSRAAWVAPGATIRVVFDSDEETDEVEGRVIEVGRSASAEARSVPVTIALSPDTRLRSGMFGRALLPGPTRDVLAVPGSAIVRRGQLTSVFVVEGGLARMRVVRLGASDGPDVSVVAGLEEGDRFVVAPPASLRDGAPVAERAGESGTTATGQEGRP